MKARQTSYCVFCINRKARVWGGWIRLGREKVIAGWCNRCWGSAARGGFIGHYVPGMGVEPHLAPRG